MVTGIALENTVVGHADFGGADDLICTLSQTGPAVLVDCFKCARCGYSVRRMQEGNHALV